MIIYYYQYTIIYMSNEKLIASAKIEFSNDIINLIRKTFNNSSFSNGKITANINIFMSLSNESIIIDTTDISNKTTDSSVNNATDNLPVNTTVELPVNNATVDLPIDKTINTNKRSMIIELNKNKRKKMSDTIISDKKIS